MTEKMQANTVQSHKAVFVRCCLSSAVPPVFGENLRTLFALSAANVPLSFSRTAPTLKFADRYGRALSAYGAHSLYPTVCPLLTRFHSLAPSITQFQKFVKNFPKFSTSIYFRRKHILSLCAPRDTKDTTAPSLQPARTALYKA